MNVNRKAWWGSVLMLVTAAGVAVAQPQVSANQGAPGRQGAWPVTTPCVTVVETVTSVGTTAVAVPTTAQSARKLILICNSSENTGSPVLKCRADGTAPVIGTAAAGQALAKGDCVSYSTTVAVRCIADTAATAASASECT